MVNESSPVRVVRVRQASRLDACIVEFVDQGEGAIRRTWTHVCAQASHESRLPGAPHHRDEPRERCVSLVLLDSEITIDAHGGSLSAEAAGRLALATDALVKS
jgi:hypothetical protein